MKLPFNRKGELTVGPKTKTVTSDKRFKKTPLFIGCGKPGRPWRKK